MDKSKGDKSSKASVLSKWGNSLMNKLPALTRNRHKRQADKARRQQAKAEIKNELE